MSDTATSAAGPAPTVTPAQQDRRANDVPVIALDQKDLANQAGKDLAVTVDNHGGRLERLETWVETVASKLEEHDGLFASIQKDIEALAAEWAASEVGGKSTSTPSSTTK